MKPIIITLLLLSAPELFSQSNIKRHEFSTFGSIGFTGLKKNFSSGEETPLQGGSFGAGYSYYLSSQWGALSGAELVFYKAAIEITSNSSQSAAGYQTTSGNLNFLQIPLMAQFQTRGKHILYLAGGFKFGFPVYESYPIDVKTVYILSGESGIKWELNATRSLYTGIYGDIGLNKVIEERSKNTSNLQRSNFFIENRTIGALGLKARLSFHLK